MNVLITDFSELLPESLRQWRETGTTDGTELARISQRTMRLAAKIMVEAISEAVMKLGEILNALTDAMARQPPRRDWSRPQNQCVRPLLIDRRRKVYHCRNAI